MKQKGKKAAVGVLAVVMVLSVGAISAFAAGPGHGGNFTDADGNGICDNAGNGCRYIDCENDGICDNRGRRSFSQNEDGRNFSDADGDGVCDNAAAGRGKRFRGGRNR